MRAFVKLKDEFGDPVWRELIAADMDGDAVVVKDDGVDYIPPNRILDEYYEDFDGPMVA